MEYKNIIYLLLFIISIKTANSQISSGEIFYKVIPTDNILDSTALKKNSSLKIIDESILEHSNKLNFKLAFSKNESLFKLVENMEIESAGYTIALIMTDAENITYINLKTKEKLIQKNAFGQNFIIKSNLNSTKWKLHNETKMIDNYKCLKATTIKIVKNSKGVFKKVFTAWYTPQIPLGYGPKGFGNLPGLILELDGDKLKYSVSKLALNSKKNIIIKKPKKGKLITEKDYEKISDDFSNNEWKNK